MCTTVNADSSCGDCVVVREANHRFANHLAMLSSFVRMRAVDLSRQPASSRTAEFGLLLESVQVQIAATAQLHRMLATDVGTLDLGEHLHMVCAPFATLLAGQMLLIEDISPGCEMAPHSVLPLTQIVAEVITNAVKHARPSREAGRIVIRGRRGAGGFIMIEIADNGPGFPEDFEPQIAAGLGLQLIEALARKLGAPIEFKSGRDGVCFRLALPPDA